MLLEHRLDLSGDCSFPHRRISRRLLPLQRGVEAPAGHAPATGTARRMSSAPQAPRSGQTSWRKLLIRKVHDRQPENFSLLSYRFSLQCRLSSVLLPNEQALFSGANLSPIHTRLAAQGIRLLEARPNRSATALQASPTSRQSSTASVYW
jgi:hypothetical protein